MTLMPEELKEEKVYVLPLKGLCRYIGTETEEVLGSKVQFYVFVPEEDKHVVKMTESQLEKAGIRAPLQPDALVQALESDTVPPIPDHRKQPRRRYSLLLTHLRSGGRGSRLQVLRQLHDLKSRGIRLTQSEVQLRSLAERTLQQELRHVLHLSELEAEKAALQLVSEPGAAVELLATTQ